ncbi:MAG: CRTAC1 family protein [Planctomycetota bacterium]|nr:CRTAC1 family protein [Planctomycetota bacterium]
MLCWKHIASAASPILLRDVSATVGLAFQHSDGSSGRRYIVETVASGLATFDYDGDGLIDTYFLTGTPLPGAAPGSLPTNRLFRNQGDWQFVDVTAASGLGCAGYGLGVAVADYDQDGFPDVYVSNFGPNGLFRNNGDGTFTEVTAVSRTGGQAASKVGAGVCFLDADQDGDLDLFVANYMSFSCDQHVPRTFRGLSIYRGPESYTPMSGCFYRNEGDGTFTDVTAEAGLAVPGWGMGVIALDYDGDGDTDIFVANDSMANYLWQNDGRGRFQEVGLPAGVGYSFRGDARGNMGVDAADYDGDGKLDLYVTAYQTQGAALYRNLGHGLFQDETLRTGAATGTIPYVTWGCAWADFDNDGARDLYVACGHLFDNVELFDGSTSYHARNRLLRNVAGKFVDVSADSGDGLAVKLSSRGVAVDDLDNDGRLDVVVLNSRREPTVLRNLSPGGSHWLQVELCGIRCNRGAVGARVTVHSGSRTLVDEVHSGRSYQSHFGTRLHFGLGRQARVERIEVRWPGGQTDVLHDVRADQCLRIHEGCTNREGLAPVDAVHRPAGSGGQP